jgi:hypothetical protein
LRGILVAFVARNHEWYIFPRNVRNEDATFAT